MNDQINVVIRSHDGRRHSDSDVSNHVRAAGVTTQIEDGKSKGIRTSSSPYAA
jgi:hypothetical protein